MTFADYILRHDPFVKLVFSLVPGEEKLLNNKHIKIYLVT